MFLSAVSVLVVTQSISEIQEGLMNNPVFIVKGRVVYRQHYLSVEKRIRLKFQTRDKGSFCVSN